MNIENARSNSIKKVLLAVVGTFFYTFGIRMFISGLGLYSGGVLGLSQLIGTLVSRYLLSFDLAGIIYYVINIPIFILAYKAIGRRFFVRTLICVTTTAIFMSVIPSPAVPLVSDRLVNCIIGGFISGFGLGLTLRMGGSTGGTDIIGLYCIKKDIPISVGNLSLSVNVVLYGICMIVFNVETAIYSILFAVASSLAVDHTYSQSINTEATVITKGHGHEIAEAVNRRLVRGVTSWSGKGEYTDEETQVLCIILSKYEISALRAIIREIDPHAFVILKEGVKIEGNYLKKLT
ncbi:MAG: YitT family protein [Oscillospiraceae bacterium]|nr:YitT family protein [Oscillospiraceae bacterium]